MIRKMETVCALTLARERILLDEPFELEPNMELIVTVIPQASTKNVKLGRCSLLRV